MLIQILEGVNEMAYSILLLIALVVLVTEHGVAQQRVSLGYRVSYLNDRGDTLVPPVYVDIGSKGDFCNGYAIVAMDTVIENRKYLAYGIIDSSGKVVVNPQYFYLKRVGQVFAARLFQNGHYVILNSNGKALNDCQYEFSTNPIFYKQTNGLIPVLFHSKAGVLDELGSVLIPFDYEDVNILVNEPFIRVKKNNKWGLITYSGKEIISPNFSKITSCENGLFLVNVGGSWVYSEGGNSLIAEHGSMKFEGGLWGIIDSNGTIKADTIYDDIIFSCSDNYLVYRIRDRYGYINRSGVPLCLDKTYDLALPFAEGLAAVREGMLWGYIDEHCRYVVVPKYAAASSFESGKATVIYEQDGGVITAEISKTGEVLKIIHANR